MTSVRPSRVDTVLEMDTSVEQPTRLDKCDRCPQPAFLRAVFPSGSELLFCQHHTRQYAVDLATKAPEAKFNVRWSEALSI